MLTFGTLACLALAYMLLPRLARLFQTTEKQWFIYSGRGPEVRSVGEVFEDLDKLRARVNVEARLASSLRHRYRRLGEHLAFVQSDPSSKNVGQSTRLDVEEEYRVLRKLSVSHDNTAKQLAMTLKQETQLGPYYKAVCWGTFSFLVLGTGANLVTALIRV